jgi:hypothetical protein
MDKKQINGSKAKSDKKHKTQNNSSSPFQSPSSLSNQNNSQSLLCYFSSSP